MLNEDQKGPLLRWMEERKLSDEQVAALLEIEGVKISPGYISLLKYGFRRGSLPVAEGIERMTRKQVKALDQMRYRRPDGNTPEVEPDTDPKPATSDGKAA